jgi:hypothetical protein
VPDNPASPSNPLELCAHQVSTANGKGLVTPQITLRYFSYFFLLKTNIINTLIVVVAPLCSLRLTRQGCAPLIPTITSLRNLLHLSPTHSTRGNSVARTGERCSTKVSSRDYLHPHRITKAMHTRCTHNLPISPILVTFHMLIRKRGNVPESAVPNRPMNECG